mgnify:CR=1 FL=1
MNAALNPPQPIVHLLSSGGFYGAERMLLDHCQATPGQHLVLFLGAPDELVARFRAAGVALLRARLLEAEQQKQSSQQAQERKLQVGSGDRSERIRTYNFPQNRVTDHRINVSLHKLEQVLEGNALDELIDALIAEDQAARLAELPV